MQTTLTLSLETPRLIIRTITEDDLADLFNVFSDDDITHFLPYTTWQNKDDARAWYDKVLENAAAASAIQCVMADKHSGKVIGSILLFRFDTECARAELGYALGKPYWGKGYMAEALKTLLPHAFTHMGFNRIEAEVDTRNAPSANLLRHLGFQQEGLMRQRWTMKGQVKDTLFFAMLGDEWVG
ncbi:GNAT family N-acetyltransferase [Undibacterium sp. TJN19]|uniref:GNAT family N-acetyltransferase n=1 Tax=Undibacterium sp. TJN19 TaxID=3413055 RepID=UPI003BF33C35